MALSKSKYEANNRYLQSHYRTIPFAVPISFADSVKLEAAARGMSVNGFIKYAIERTIAADNSPAADRGNSLSLCSEPGIEGLDR